MGMVCFQQPRPFEARGITKIHFKAMDSIVANIESVHKSHDARHIESCVKNAYTSEHATYIAQNSPCTGERMLLNYVIKNRMPAVSSYYGLLQESRQTKSYRGQTQFHKKICDDVTLMATIDMMEDGHVVEIKNSTYGYTDLFYDDLIQIMMYMWATDTTTYAIHRQYYLGIPRDTYVDWNSELFHDLRMQFIDMYHHEQHMSMNSYRST